MFISIQQVKAARALLDWTQEDLAAHAGIDVNRLRGFESGRTKPLEVVEAVQSAFTRAGILFMSQGVQLQTFSVVEFEGEGWFLRLLDDVYNTLSRQNNPEFLCFYTDDRASTPEVNERIRRIRSCGAKMRQLVEADNTYLMGPLSEYRYVPREKFRNYVSIVYGDKVAVCAVGNTKAIVFKDSELSKAWHNTFDLLWETLQQPTRSDADEKF